MGEVGAAYAGCRARITELVGGLDRERASTMVPTCPDWSVHDVVAHLAGGVEDAMTGRLEGLGTERWTAAQVEARRDTPTPQILQDWNGRAPVFEKFLDPAGDLGRQAVADIVSHEHDIRTALFAPGARDSDAVRIGLGWSAAQLIASAAVRGVALRVRTREGMDLGRTRADVTLAGSAFELLRAVTGRRSVEQLREMDWSGDCEDVIPAFSWFSLRPSEKRIDE
jgi:uncharacterized protein (TIGR03083 family)